MVTAYGVETESALENKKILTRYSFVSLLFLSVTFFQIAYYNQS